LKQQLSEKLVPFGQQHLLTFWDGLDEAGQRRLAAQINAIDFRLIERLTRDGASHEDWQALSERAAPPPAVRAGEAFSLIAGRSVSSTEARERGQQALAVGQIGVLLVAGGQGSRLGFEHPKGMFPIGPVSSATLFQIHFEKVVATARRYGARIPVYVMTSPATHEETIVFLDSHDRFGLAADDLTIFCQGTMPAVDAATGKLLLADRDQLFLSPDGHGGTVEALRRSGVIEQMGAAGIEHLFYFQVDNPLAPVADPEFLGYHLLAESELTTLVVAKQSPEEKLGNVVSVDGKLQIIEYTDLPVEAAGRRAEDGSLALWAGSTAIHGMDVAFLDRMTRSQDGLPFHVSEKKVPHLDVGGQRIEPEKPNALKFERFIFDLLPAAERTIVVEARPADCFAPVKNGAGAATDTPVSARAAIVAMHRHWLEQAGSEVIASIAVEISPLWALDAQQVADRIPAGQKVVTDTYFV